MKTRLKEEKTGRVVVNNSPHEHRKESVGHLTMGGVQWVLGAGITGTKWARCEYSNGGGGGGGGGGVLCGGGWGRGRFVVVILFRRKIRRREAD